MCSTSSDTIEALTERHRLFEKRLSAAQPGDDIELGFDVYVFLGALLRFIEVCTNTDDYVYALLLFRRWKSWLGSEYGAIYPHDVVKRHDGDGPDSVGAVPRDVFPWRWFDDRLIEVSERLASAPVEHKYEKVAEEFYIPVKSARALSRLAVPLQELVSADPALLSRYIVRFIGELWTTELQYMPGRTRGYLMTFLNRAVIALKRAKYRGAAAPSVVGLAVVRGGLLLNKVRELAALLDRVDVFRNLALALTDAEGLGFLDTQTRCPEQQILLESLATAARDVPEYKDFRYQDFEATTKPHSDAEMYYTLLNIADVLRYSGYVRRYAEPIAADRLFEKAHGYYIGASSIRASAGMLRGLLYQRWARNYIGRGDLARRLRQADPRECYDQALALLDDLATGDYQRVAPDISEHGLLRLRNLIKAEALLGKAMIEGDVPDPEPVEALVAEDPSRQPSWRVLFEYYSRRDIEDTLRRIQRWLGKPEASAYAQKLRLTAANIASSSGIPELAVTALQLFVDVLATDHRAYTAAAQIIELWGPLSQRQKNAASAVVKSALKPVTAVDCPSSHAAVRLALFTEFNEGPFAALKEAASGSGEWWKDRDRLQAAVDHIMAAGFDGWRLVEAMSKHLCACGRAAADKTSRLSYLNMSGALLDLARATRPTDLVWLDRRIRVCVYMGDKDRAGRLLQYGINEFPDDLRLRLLEVHLMLITDRGGAAAEILEKLRPKCDGEKAEIALLDTQASVALKSRDFPAAERSYGSLLDIAPTDDRAWAGLGRVKYEMGNASWPEALDCWVTALRHQALSATTAMDQKAARRTACSIAALFLDLNQHTPSVLDQLIDKLQLALRRGEPQVCVLIVKALASLGVVQQGVISAVWDAARENGERTLKKAVAQLFMAHTVFGTISSGSWSPPPIGEYIDWCRAERVLGDYVAGAKGAHVRALSRLRKGGADIQDAVRTLLSGTTTVSARPVLRNLLSHVSKQKDEQSADYYTVAYQLAWAASPLLSEAYARRQVAEIAWKIAQIMEYDEGAALALVEPAVGLRTMLVGACGTTTMRLSADGDADVWDEAKRLLGIPYWEAVDNEIIGEVHRTPSASLLLEMARKRVYIRPKEGGGLMCSVADISWTPSIDLEPAALSATQSGDAAGGLLPLLF